MAHGLFDPALVEQRLGEKSVGVADGGVFRRQISLAGLEGVAKRPSARLGRSIFSRSTPALVGDPLEWRKGMPHC